ncbi:MAG: M20/M25/M40 family metallo-hydrolase, partial [Gammaproteobacteria bacterium]|nr:M20/M25/M40 family metallo-hydrolase [Gammaproteobacteria bacterium]
MSSTYYQDAMEVKPDLVKFMQDIIRIPSLSSEEGAVVERIRDEMLRIGYDEVTIDPMGNVIGRIGSGPRVIAFDGHVDIVDVGDPSLWDRDPYSAEIEDGILYGRGTSDMKGGVASSVYAGALLKKRG